MATFGAKQLENLQSQKSLNLESLAYYTFLVEKLVIMTIMCEYPSKSFEHTNKIQTNFWKKRLEYVENLQRYLKTSRRKNYIPTVQETLTILSKRDTFFLIIIRFFRYVM